MFWQISRNIKKSFSYLKLKTPTKDYIITGCRTAMKRMYMKPLESVKNMYVDYMITVRELQEYMRNHPFRTIVLYPVASLIGFELIKLNPDENHFIEEVFGYSSEFLTMPVAMLRPAAIEHIQKIQEAKKQNMLHRTNLGICSVIWISGRSSTLSSYEGPYLGKTIEELKEMFVDVGFLNTWWMLDKKLKDYDVNF